MNSNRFFIAQSIPTEPISTYFCFTRNPQERRSEFLLEKKTEKKRKESERAQKEKGRIKGKINVGGFELAHSSVRNAGERFTCCAAAARRL